jgi:flagellin
VNLLDGSYSATFLLGTKSTDTVSASISTAVSASGLGLSGTAVKSISGAASASALIDSAINTVSGLRAQVGADSSRVNFRTQVINVSQENATAAASNLLDADVASVESQYTSVEALTEAGIAALQKANAIPQQLLNLLKS